MDDRDLTPGDPLEGAGREHREGSLFRDPAAPRPPERPERPDFAHGRPVPAPERPDPYGGAPVPPGAFAGRPAPPPLPRQGDLAEYWRRALAVAIDALIVALVVFILAVILGALIGDASTNDDSEGVGWVVLGAVLLFLLFYPVAALLYLSTVMAATNGQTLGKLATGCRVVRVNGKRVDFWWAVWREVVIKGVLLGIAGAITGGLAYLADFIWPLPDSQNRALHDFVADSRVVRTRS